MTVSAATAASLVSLAIYAMDQVRLHQAGEITDEELQSRWDALQVRRNDTRGIWADARAQGGYSG